MSHSHGEGSDRPAAASDQKSWERPSAADDIVDPIDGGAGDEAARAGLDPYAATDADGDRELSDEDAEDAPLEVRFTDALSMLADGGHDYGATPLAADGPVIEEDAADTIEIDESSKDA